MAVTTYQDIRSMSLAFKEMLDTNRTSLPFDVDNSALIVLVDVQKNLNTILSHNPAKLAVAIGLENGRLTICLLGADENGQPLTKEGPVSLSADDPDPDPAEEDGEEAWPDEEQITTSENSEYNNFFHP